MRHPLDPRDGWPVVSVWEFLGTVAVAVGIVIALWAAIVLTLVLGEPAP